MTEAEWKACTDPEPMLRFVREKASKRKMRLFCCACGRVLWDRLVDKRSMVAVETSEAFADGLVSEKVLNEAQVQAAIADQELEEFCVEGNPQIEAAEERWNAAEAAWSIASTHPFEWEIIRHVGFLPIGHASSIVRDIFGNSFRPVTIDPQHLTASLTSIAQAIYTDRAFDRLPILADALEDAGCTDPDILAHCRGPGPHVRGCWVVDLLTGRE